jgi:hypothetical protein
LGMQLMAYQLFIATALIIFEPLEWATACMHQGTRVQLGKVCPAFMVCFLCKFCT